MLLRDVRTVIPAEAVEAAAKALRKKFNGYEVERPWDSRDQRTTYHNDAIAALEAAAPHMREDKRGAALTGGEATFTNEEVDVAATKLYVSSGKTYPWEHLPEAVKAPYIYTAISNLNNQRP